MNETARVLPTSLGELASLFLRLGATAFGGPAAHVALMQYEVVHKRRWLSQEEFLDLYGATNFIPGPNSTELAIHIGYRRRGWAGLFVAGACFIVPAALIVAALAWAYVSYGGLPEVRGILYGVKPVILAVIAQAVLALGRSALKTKLLLILAIGALSARLMGMNELLILACAGLIALVFSRRKVYGSTSMFTAAALGFSGKAIAAFSPAAGVGFGLVKLFVFFLKVGSVLFGSGYVLIAFLRTDLVEKWGWLTEAQLLDAIAVGQFTPGPVFTTATFIGYILGGPAGAFLPAFFFVGISAPFIARFRRSPAASALLNGLNAASLAIMASAGLMLGKDGVSDWLTGAICLVSLVLLLRRKVNSAWLVLGGGLIGFCANFA
jgi:chromate transporter